MAGNDDVGNSGQPLDGLSRLREIGRVEVATPLSEEVASHDRVRSDNDRHSLAVEAQAVVAEGVPRRGKEVNASKQRFVDRLNQPVILSALIEESGNRRRSKPARVREVLQTEVMIAMFVCDENRLYLGELQARAAIQFRRHVLG